MSTVAQTSRKSDIKYGILNLEVMKCTEDKDDKGNSKGTFCLTLLATKSVTVFGKHAERTLTFYLRVNESVAVGTADKIDTDQFDIIERLYEPEEGKSIWLKNLVPAI